ncbi:hypothetical protein RQP46_005616 [Phenoliferia psychrophenolica]
MHFSSLASIFAMMVSTGSIANAQYTVQQSGAGFIGGAGGCSSNYQGSSYADVTLSPSAIFRCFCNPTTVPPPVYSCNANYPYSYPVQGGTPPQGFESSGCGCDGYALDYASQPVPSNLPKDFQFYG